MRIVMAVMIQNCIITPPQCNVCLAHDVHVPHLTISPQLSHLLPPAQSRHPGADPGEPVSVPSVQSRRTLALNTLSDTGGSQQ